MNQTKLVLAIGALSMAATQAALAAEFTVTGVVENTYHYNNAGGGNVEQGDLYVATIVYDANSFAPDYTNNYIGYGYQHSQWYNRIQSVEVAVFDPSGTEVHSSLLSVDESGLTYSSSTVETYRENNNGYEHVYFWLQTEQSDGQVQDSQWAQLYFYSYAMNLILDINTFTESISQADLDNGTVVGQMWNYDYTYNHQTGQWEQWEYGGRITSLSGEIPTDPDADDDGIPDADDAFPNDPTESADTDGDGVGNNGDAFPNDATETADTDGDGVGNNADVFPNDATESADTDGDGVGNNGDVFPNDATETADTDGDGVGNNGDVFPNDATESADADGDGVGNNADQNDSSDLSATVSIDGNNSGVANPLVSNGQSLADIINAAGTECKATAKNHGAYTSCVGKTLNTLKAAGTITDAQKGALQSTVAKSSFGKK